MTDTTNEAIAAMPTSDARLAEIRQLVETGYGKFSFPEEIGGLLAAIEKLQAERDAALAFITALGGTGDQIAEWGARQERAAIVADLRERYPASSDPVDSEARSFADRYERGDHLKETGQ